MTYNVLMGTLNPTHSTPTKYSKNWPAPRCPYWAIPSPLLCGCPLWMTPNALPVAQRTAPKHCSALVDNKSEDSCCLLEESQRTVKEVWELSQDVFYNSPIHIDTISVFVSYACKACLQFGLPMTMLCIVWVCHDQLRQRQVIGSCLTQSAVETDVTCTITIVFLFTI